jgi:hypothetical protein
VAPPRKRPTKAAITKEIVVNRSSKLSPRKLDEIAAAAEWRVSELVDVEGGLTGKGIAGLIWLSIREDRADLTPVDLYDMEDPADLGIELVQEGPPTPTKAAG